MTNTVASATCVSWWKWALWTAGTTPYAHPVRACAAVATPPTSIFTFVREAGISKSDNLIDMRQLEVCIRSELDATARAACRAGPVK